MGTHIVRTIDKDLIYDICSIPEVWDTISSENQDVNSWWPDTNNNLWLLSLLPDNTIIGSWLLNKFNHSTIEIHPVILPKYRRKYAFEAGQTALTWMRENLHIDMQKCVGLIPKCYRHVRWYALKNGFVHEGTLTKSYLKYGELQDIYIYGIRREDWGKVEQNKKRQYT